MSTIHIDVMAEFLCTSAEISADILANEQVPQGLLDGLLVEKAEA